MHFYSFNIGDYDSHTKHLTPIEDLIYRRLLDLYYLTEQPINASSTVVARRINMRGHEDEVQSILDEFFELTHDNEYINKRADEEISKYHSKLEAASRAGKASAQRRLNDRSTDVQLNKKQETINNKQETNKKKAIAKPEDVSEKVWEDFVQHRKSVKAPLTETALNGIAREALLANMSLEDALKEICQRGWRGFKAEWVQEARSRTGAKSSSWADEQREWVAEATGANKIYEPDIFDVALQNTRKIK